MRETLVVNPPLPGKGGYVGREDEIENLLQAALSTGDAELLEAMLKAFAEAQDWYFCYKLMEITTVSQSTEVHVANAAMKAPHLGGQSGDYFHLLTILSKNHNDVRKWCEAIRKKERPNSILAENMELVLAGRA